MNILQNGTIKRHSRQSMMHARSFICKINSSCLLSRVRRVKSTTTFRVEHSKTNNESNELQQALPTKDIPGPKALPLLGNWFRFIPYIGKRSFLSLQI